MTDDSRDAELLRQLRLMNATLRLAFASQVEDAKEEMLQDKVTAAILGTSVDWIASKELQASVVKKTKKTSRTVRDRLSELLTKGVIEARGTERRVEYRRTGVI